MARTVCIVSSGNLASNPRLVKEADALQEAGYAVTAVFCRYTESLRSFDDEIAAKAKWTARPVDRLDGERYISAIARAGVKLLAACRAPVPVRLAAAAYGGPSEALRLTARTVKADLYIAHYVPALPAAAEAARFHGGLLGFDAEDFHSGEGTDSPSDRFQSMLVERIESACLRHCVHMTAASPLIGKAYADKYGVAPETVLNVFPMRMASALEPVAAARPPGTLRAYWFSQTIGLDRGLQNFIQGISRARTRVTLDIRGSNRWGHGDTLLGMARKLGMAERVSLLPMAPPDEMVQLAAPYDLGLSLEMPVTENRGICLTNKIFTYLLAGVPVMMSDTPAQKALAPDLGAAARVVSLDDPDRIARELDELAEKPGMLGAAKAVALNLGRRRYNWDIEKRILVDAVAAAFARDSRRSNSSAMGAVH